MAHTRRFAIPLLSLLAGAAALGAPRTAAAVDPLLRHQATQRGDVVVFGSTLAYDCGAGVPAPQGSTVSCASQSNVADTAPDLYWHDGIADSSIAATSARTSATLTLPPNANVTYARLYWAALKDGPSADTDATLDWLGGPAKTITADDSWVVSYGFASHPNWYYYQSSGDATDFVKTWGAGDFRVSDVEAIALANQDVDRAFSAWTLVVFYERQEDEVKNLALFDGFTSIDPGFPGQESAQVTLSGFLVPPGFTARMTALTYEGDQVYTGDHFTMNGVEVQNSKNALDNFFNSSRSSLGAAVSGLQDVPKLSGEPGSMAGYDLDTIDVTAQLSAGDTSATVAADSALDIFLLGGFVTSVVSLAPDFAEMTKTALDVNGGAALQGDELEFTITAKNTGNDAAAGAVLTDVLEPNLTFVPGSIQIVQGGPAGKKTDKAGDDQGEYDAATKTITVRVGEGADANKGGAIAVGATVTVSFRAKVAIAKGSVTNQAKLGGSGASGAPPKTWLSDGDSTTVGDQPTIVPIDECTTDADCSGTTPVCDLATHTCTGCATDADCHDPALPACQPDGSCGQCSATNDSQCKDPTPVCDTDDGICVLCTPGPDGDASECQDSEDGPLCIPEKDDVHCGCEEDADCGAIDSGRVCDPNTKTCDDGCRGDGGNGCPDGKECTSTDSTIGDCVDDDGGAGSSGGVEETPGDTGGCACTVPVDERNGAAPIGLAAAMLGLALARRRRARRDAP